MENERFDDQTKYDKIGERIDDNHFLHTKTLKRLETIFEKIRLENVVRYTFIRFVSHYFLQVKI